MDNTLHQEAVKAAVSGRFLGSQKLKSRYIPLHPSSSEREMQRIANGYMRIVTQEFKEILPGVMEAYEREIRNDSRMDSIADLREKMRNGFTRVKETIGKRIEEFSLTDRLQIAATTIKNSALREWKKAVSRTLGVEIMDEYYRDELYRDAMARWVQDQNEAMNKIPNEFMERVQKIIEKGYREGKPTSETKREIQHLYTTMKNEAVHNAAGSTTTLNYECTRINQEDAGVREYMWYTRRDSRVRPCHRSFDGKTFRWDGPPEIWYETKHEGKIWTGRYCHPGQDYNCRCCAVPVFTKESINLPIKGRKRGGK